MDFIGRSLIADALEQWREHRRSHERVSPLRDLRATASPYLDLRSSHPGGLARLFAGRATSISSLVRDATIQPRARTTARAILKECEASLAATGSWSAALAIGTVTWVDVDGTVEMPLLLRNVELLTLSDRDIDITLHDESYLNPVFREVVRLRDAAAARELPDAGAGSDFEPRPLWDAVRDLSHVLPDVAVADRLVLACYDDAEQRLLDDLDDLDSVISSAPLVAAIAGDTQAARHLLEPLPAAPVGDRDPFGERGLGDLDDTSFAIVDVAALGRSFVVDTPPGADGTSIAASIAADAAATGRSAVVASGRPAGARAVGERLRQLGASDVTFDATGDQWSRDGRSRLLDSITAGAPAPVEGLRALGHDLVAARERLLRALDDLNRSHRPWGVSANESIQALARLTVGHPSPLTDVRLSPEAGIAVNEHGVDAVAAAISEHLGSAQAEEPEPARERREPWWTGSLDGDEGALADAALTHLVVRQLPKMRQEAELASHSTGVDRAPSFAVWREQVGLFDEVRAILDDFSPAVFHHSLRDLVDATAPRGSSSATDLPRRERRVLARRAGELLRPGRSRSDLHARLTQAYRVSTAWRSHASAGGWPRVPDDFDIYLERVDSASESWDQIAATVAAVTGIRDLAERPWEEMIEALDTLTEGIDPTSQPARGTGEEIELAELHLDEFIADARSRDADERQIRVDLEFAWWAAAFDAIIAINPEVIDFAAVDKAATQYLTLDARFATRRAEPLRAAVAELRRRAVGRYPDSARDLFAALVEGGGTIRKFWTDHGALMAALRPVVLTALETVPRILPPSRAVDVAILVDVEDVTLAEIVATVARARQVIVVGDVRSAGPGALGQLSALLPSMAMRGYPQPRDPRVTEVLSRHVYGRGLASMPPAGERGSLRVIEVESSGASDDGLTSEGEVARVVDHVAARIAAGAAVAVVAGSRTHAAAVREALDARANLAMSAVPVRVIDQPAGPEVDEVVVTLGFCSASGSEVLSLGTLSGEHGAGRLARAIVGAREDTTVVTSIDRERLALLPQEEGSAVPMLSALVAAPAAPRFDLESTARAQRDALLGDLADRLRQRGLMVAMPYGTQGVTVPLAVAENSREPFTIAIVPYETAVPTAASVRDRVRWMSLAPQAAGWTAVPVWSMDIFMDPARVADRILAIARGEDVGDHPMLDFEGEWTAHPGDEPAPVDEPGEPLDVDLAANADAGAPGAPADGADGTETVAEADGPTGESAPEPQPEAEPEPATLGISLLSGDEPQTDSRPSAADVVEPEASVDEDVEQGAAPDARDESDASAPGDDAADGEQDTDEQEGEATVDDSQATRAFTAAEAREATAPRPVDRRAHVAPARTPATSGIGFSMPKIAPRVKPAPASAPATVDDDPVLPTRSKDDMDEGWSDGYGRSRDDEIREDRPPHW